MRLRRRARRGVGIRLEPAAAIVPATRRANPPGAGARVDGSVAEITEAGVIGVEFFPNRGGSQHALIPCSS